jgi:hypothetical protein
MPHDACKPAGVTVADVLGTDLPATVGLSGLKPLPPPPEEARLQGRRHSRERDARHPGGPDGLCQGGTLVGLARFELATP